MANQGFLDLMVRCRVPKRFLKARLSHFTERCRKIGQTGESLFITGPRGTGKTHFLCACISDFIEKKITNGEVESVLDPRQNSIRFLPVPELMLEFKQSYNPGAKRTEGEILDEYSRLDLLILDDLGAERVNEWSIQMLYLLIDRRYREEKTSMISSNLSLAELEEQIDDRIASRIVEMCIIKEFQGEDKRLQKPANLKGCQVLVEGESDPDRGGLSKPTAGRNTIRSSPRSASFIS